MSDYIDETPLTDDEVAAAIAEAKANKSQRSKKSRGKDRKKPDAAKNIDDESSDDLMSASSSAAQLEEEEDESPAVRSAKSFSNAFAAAKKKREQDLLKKREERKAEPEEDEDDEEENETKESLAAVAASAEDEEDAEFETDSEEEEYEYEEDDEDDDEYEYEDDDEEEDDDEDEEEDDDDEDYDGIFETDDENGEYNTVVNVDDGDDDDNDDDDDEDDDDEEDDSAFSTKTKVIIGIVIAILVIAIIAAIVFFAKGSGNDNDNTSSVVSAADGEVTSVKFAEPSISVKVGETAALKIIVEPENATDKTFKLKSNDDTIAKVTDQGQIVGVSSGSTTVTATLKSNPTMTASLVVNVIDDEQSALNTYNKFVNAILEGTTDIDSEADEDTDSSAEDADQTEAADGTEENSDSDTDTEGTKHKSMPTHVFTGNKIADFDSDGTPELALYYEPSTDSAEPLVRIFHLVSADEAKAETEAETDSDEVQYDEFGNVIEPEETDSETEESEAPAESADKETDASKLVLAEIAKDSELYSKCYSAIEADSASNPWNTSYVQVKEGEQAAARVNILSSGYANPTYTYETENEEIATVDAQGNIKGLKPGIIFVTVSSPLNSDAVAKIKVRVKDDTDLLDDYLADIPVVNNTNDSVFPTETLTGKAIVDIDNDGMSELLLRFRYSSNVEAIHIVKVENEKCVVYKTYNNISDLYEYNDGSGSYSNAILVHYTTGRVCLEYKAVVAKSGSTSRTSEEKILTLENGGTLSELVNFRTTTDISTKTVASEVSADSDKDSERDSDSDTEGTTSSRGDDESSDSDEPTYYDDTDTETEENSNDSDEEGTSSYIDEDEDGYDDITGEYFGSFAAFTFDEIAANGIDMSKKTPVKILPQAAGAPGDDEDYDYDFDYDYDDNEYDDYSNDDGDDDANSDNDADSGNDSDSENDDEDTTSTVTHEVTEENTKYFVNGTPVDQSVYEETLTRYSATYSVWNSWEAVNG